MWQIREGEGEAGEGQGWILIKIYLGVGRICSIQKALWKNAMSRNFRKQLKLGLWFNHYKVGFFPLPSSPPLCQSIF